MGKPLFGFLKLLGDAVRDLSPIILVIAFFQTIVLQQPFPDLVNVLIGLICVVIGLALFVQGLEVDRLADRGLEVRATVLFDRHRAQYGSRIRLVGHTDPGLIGRRG